jgi:hypothetical protein
VGRTGGFSLYGQAPASVWLTAYGLMQWRDMEEVHPVDPRLLARVRHFLVSHAEEARWIGEDAYVVRALGRDAPPDAVARLVSRADELASDPYLRALGALALRPHDPRLARELASGLRADDLRARRTVAWGRGETETTALAALALLETGVDPDLAATLVRRLTERTRPGGGWGSTHATVFALKALLHAPEERESMQVTLSDGERAVALDDATPFATLAVARGAHEFAVEGDAVVRVSGTAFLPWRDDAGALTVRYDTTVVERGGVVGGVARLRQDAGKIAVPMIEWGLPAGFRPIAADLDALVRKGTLRRWEQAGRTLRLYVAEFDGDERAFEVRFRATARGELKSAPSRAYPYYRRGDAPWLAPTRFVVR